MGKNIQTFLIVGCLILFSGWNKQDLTTYVEVDSGSDIEITADTMTVAQIQRDAASYVAKDFGLKGILTFEATFQVNIDDLIPILFRHFPDHAVPVDPGVAHHDVEPSECGDNLPD